MAKKMLPKPAPKVECLIHSLSDVITAYTCYGCKGMMLELAIIKAVLTSSLSGSDKAHMIVMGGHQHRLLCNAAKPACTKLIKAVESSQLWTHNYAGKTFDNLYNDVVSVVSGIGYAGQITKYDIAKRIGTAFGIQPKYYVYLHSGALIGAQRLLGNPTLKEGRYPVAMFTSFFPSLNAMEIEDILCVFHNCLDKGGVVIRYMFDAPNVIIPCHSFYPPTPVKTRVNVILSGQGLPLLKIP